MQQSPMRRPRQQYASSNGDDIESGNGVIPSPPVSRSLATVTSTSDLEFFEDLVSDPVLVLGVDISHLPRNSQFLLCACGVFFFSLLYGYLQELISVTLCSRRLGLFLAMVQFTGYALLAFVLRTYVYEKQKRSDKLKKEAPHSRSLNLSTATVPFKLYLGLSILRAIDLGMTNLAMQYINYPAKTLMKSSRVVFTMIFGVLIAKKVYKCMDYFIVACMVAGLVVFMHADANSSAVFEPRGVIMLTISLTCDGAITNMSESIMNQFGVGQDEFIFRMYSIALVAITGAAIAMGDMRDGIVWIMLPGTYDEQLNNVPLEERAWSSSGKIGAMILFSSMGFFGSSCSAAITKNFGALTMSIVSTTRKATTLFLSFLLFDNACTFEHIVGIAVFISALTAKSMRRKYRKGKPESIRTALRQRVSDLEAESRLDPPSSSGLGDISLSSHRRTPRRTTSSKRQAPPARYHVV